MWEERIQKVREWIKEKKADAVLVSSAYNIQYLTGFIGLSPYEREAFCLVDGEKTTLVVPMMYEEHARSLGKQIVLCIDGERKGLLPLACSLLQGKKIVLIEEHVLKHTEYVRLQQDGGEFRSAELYIEHLRERKDDHEIALLKMADELTKTVLQKFEYMLKTVDYTQFSELQCTDMLRTMAIEVGGDGLSFDPIVASGVGNSQPHYRTSSKKLEKNGVILVDVGVKYHGYCGDLTRTFLVGDVSDEVKNVYAAVEAGHDACVKQVRIGVTGAQLYETLYSSFRESGFLQPMPHSLGHGVGLELHEGPHLKPSAEQALQKGMVVTIEPGIYRAGKFGVRIESMRVIE
ncbi:MAG: aminopeptidase P family protein [Candidatus Pacebacteria bacterium]|nr:aminopeptidase P family protein [Candidatus Paceibacterota bacterium]